LYSSAAGFSDALAFVRKSKTKMRKLSGTLGAVCSVMPANQQFGYFAPQVCAEFRLLVRLGDSRTGAVKDVKLHLSSEAELLLASMNTATQDDLPAKIISAAYASYAMSQEPNYDYARVYVQAELMPPLDHVDAFKRQWVSFKGFYFKR